MNNRRIARGGRRSGDGGRSQQLMTASRTRVAAMLLAGAVVGVTTGALGAARYAPLAGWDSAALVFSVLAWIPIGFYDPLRTASHAAREEPGRTVTSAIVIVASVASLGAVGVIIGQANSAKGAAQDLIAGFAVASVALSWFAVHTLFTLRYARLYFAGADGGISFNQKLAPRYLDFAYLAFTLGMTFQVSDTDLQNSAIRATALRHALLSYLFGAVILASTINLIAGLYFAGADGGISFNQKLAPRYLDFAYLAFTLGMTFQVSDTDLQNSAIRATALRHALLSYLFGAVILASTINLIAGLGSGGS